MFGRGSQSRSFLPTPSRSLLRNASTRRATVSLGGGPTRLNTRQVGFVGASETTEQGDDIFGGLVVFSWGPSLSRFPSFSAAAAATGAALQGSTKGRLECGGVRGFSSKNGPRRIRARLSGLARTPRSPGFLFFFFLLLFGDILQHRVANTVRVNMHVHSARQLLARRRLGRFYSFYIERVLGTGAQKREARVKYKRLHIRRADSRRGMPSPRYSAEETELDMIVNLRQSYRAFSQVGKMAACRK